VQAREPRAGEPGDGDVAQRPDRERAHNGFRPQRLAAGERDRHAAGRDIERHDRRAQPQPLAELRRHRERERRAPAREAQALPALHAVDLLGAGGAHHAQQAEQRAPLVRPARHAERGELVEP
jgi:hypothetical protein